MNIKLKNEKEWNIKKYDAAIAENLSESLGISEFLARLLAARGFESVPEAKDFLSSGDFAFHDPFLLQDMGKAVLRIKRAVESGEKILIYGDYDVDGISSVSALYLYLYSKGAKVCYYIPERLSEGYGLNRAAIEKFAAAKINLIITVDTGITSVSETDYIKELGMDSVITDHHECPETLPTAPCAVINPKRRDSKYPFCELAGVGVVFKLICALDGNRNMAELCRKYLGIVALGTVADVMPIYNENRRIVTHGIEVLNNTQYIGEGIKALLDEAVPEKSGTSRKITSSTIGFAIAPRLNAAGRIGNVKNAVELLITRDGARAKEIAEELCILNRERQTVENKIFSEAIEKISSEIDFENDRIIVLADENWHQGVVGIVASRITEKYGLPSILITFKENIGKGSARSIPGFNINEALGECDEFLLKHGGHELAAGLSVEKDKLADFKAAINDYAKEHITDEMRVAHIYADCEVMEDELDLNHAEELSILEPYGNSNPAPVFVLREAVIETVTPIGMNKHLRIVLEKNGRKFSAVYFNKSPDEFGLSEGYTVDAAFNLEINEFRSNRSIQLNIKDMKISGPTSAYINRQAKDYLRAVASFTISKENLPDMQAFRAAFVYIRSNIKRCPDIDICKYASGISHDFSIKVTPCMLNVMLDIFEETGLICVERESLYNARVTLNSVDGKVNLENSKFLTRLRGAVM